MPFLLHAPESPRFNPVPRALDLFARGRKSKVPVGGWTQEEFLKDGPKLLRDMLMVRRLAVRSNASRLTKAVSEMLEKELADVMSSFVSRVRHGAKAKRGDDFITLTLRLDLPSGAEGMFADALKAVFSPAAVKSRTSKVFRPVYQSVMDNVARKTQILIGATPESLPPGAARMAQAVSMRVDGLCEKVTRVSDTTKRRMREVFARKFREMATVGDVMATFTDEFPGIASWRIPTIVRNEMSNAANAAQLLGLKSIPGLTHCSVVGCQAVEPESPTYKGFHTCNIRNVPIEDVDEVEFHINHTGSWVPSGFRTKAGRVPDLPLGNSPGIGHPDNPRALRYTDPARAGVPG